MSQQKTDVVICKMDITVIGKNKTLISVEGAVEGDGDAQSVMTDALNAYHKCFPDAPDALVRPSFTKVKI